MPGNDKTLTTRIRRMAERQQVSVSRSRRRDPFAPDWGWTVDNPAEDFHRERLSTADVLAYLERRIVPPERPPGVLPPDVAAALDVDPADRAE